MKKHILQSALDKGMVFLFYTFFDVVRAGSWKRRKDWKICISNRLAGRLSGAPPERMPAPAAERWESMASCGGAKHWLKTDLRNVLAARYIN